MTISNWLKTAALVGCLVTVIAGCKKEEAAAPPAATSPADAASLQATAKAVSEAMKKGDAAAMKPLVTGTDAQMKALEFTVPAQAAVEKLMAAADAKFGKGNAISARFLKLPDLAEQAANGEVTIRMDHATIKPKPTPDDTHPLDMKFARQNGKWLLNLEYMCLPTPSAAAEEAPLTKSANEVADEINAGKYKKVEEADAALSAKMAANTPASSAPPKVTVSIDGLLMKSTANSVSEAMKKGDGAAMKDLMSGTDAQMKVFELMVPTLAAFEKMRAAADARFGKANAFTAGLPPKTPDPGELAASGEERIDGDHGTITPKATADDPHPKELRFVKKDGKWLMEIDTGGRSLPTPEVAAALGPMAKASNELADEIAAGKYAKAEDAAVAYSAKMDAVRSAMTKPTSLPSH